MASTKKSLAERIEQTRARLQQMEAKEQTSRRKSETREKIVIGGTVLAAMREDEGFRRQVVKMLEERVTRPADRTAVAQWLRTP